MRMEGWMARYLSLGGRITLAKYVLSSLPVYQMQTSKIPVTILQEMDNITKRFAWGGDD